MSRLVAQVLGKVVDDELLPCPLGSSPDDYLAQSPGRLLGTEDPRVVVRLER